VTLDPNEIPHHIVGACMEVHRHLGLGLPVEVYRDCLAIEFRMKEIVHERNAELPFFYKGQRAATPLRVDFLIEHTVLVAVEYATVLTPEHKTRLRNQLTMTGHEVGLLINFGVEQMRDGIKRIIVAETPPKLHYREEPSSTSTKRPAGSVV
jgi:GxxExxY protein